VDLSLDGGDEQLTMVGLLFECASGLRRVFDEQLDRDPALSGQAFDVLIRLARTPGERLRMAELAVWTSLSPSGLTRAVDRLVDAGLVEREACPEDRRGAFAVLSESGRSLMAAAVPRHADHVRSLVGPVLTSAEQAELQCLLRKLRDHLRGLPTGSAPTGSAADPAGSSCPEQSRPSGRSGGGPWTTVAPRAPAADLGSARITGTEQ
jgi:DNA-binding MarR family transcriptional regulator